MKAAFFLAIGILLGLGLAPGEAQAAAIDCTRPTLPITRFICNNPTLSRTDEALADVYSAATAATLDRPSLEAAEEKWFDDEVLSKNWFAERHLPVDAEQMLQAYERHMDDLRATTQQWQKVHAAMPADQLAKSCLVLPPYAQDGDCTVTTFGSIEGDPTLRYQLQGFAKDNPAAALVVFQASGDDPHQFVPLVAGTAHRNGKAARYDVPGAINSRDGRFLIVDGAFTDDDHADAFTLYRYGERTAFEIDTTSWLRDLRQRLPPGLTIGEDIAIDYVKMTATVVLARKSDGGSNGHAELTLKIDQNRLAIRDVKFVGTNPDELGPNGQKARAERSARTTAQRAQCRLGDVLGVEAHLIVLHGR